MKNMMRTALVAVVVTGFTLGSWTSPAQAHHNQPEVSPGVPGQCGEVELTSLWPIDQHQVDNTVVVVQVDGSQQAVPIGTPVTVGPFTEAETTIRWRIWGGGERDYDSPELEDLDALVAYLEEDPDHTPLDFSVPGVTWYKFEVEGCPATSSPSPTPTQTEPEPDPEPTPSEDPSPTPTESDPEPEPTPSPEESLPLTSGVTMLPALLLGGTALVGLGGTMAWLGRRKRVASTD